MEIDVDHSKKLVSVWLTQAESQDAAMKEQLGALYLSYWKQKYKVAVFHSGHEDLYQNTLELLRMNRRRSAARAVQSAKSTPER